MNKNDYEIITGRIRKTIKNDASPLVEVNIEYPVIRSNYQNDNYNKINDFYSRCSESFYIYCEKKISEKARTKMNSTDFRTFGEIVKFFVPFCDNEYLSVVCDITHFDGYFKKTSRLSQTWRIEDAVILPVYYFLRKEGVTTKIIRRNIGDIIHKSIGNDREEFSYTAQSIKKYACKVNTKNYFLSDRGMAFWFESGTLAPESEGFPTFIIPYKTKTEPS